VTAVSPAERQRQCRERKRGTPGWHEQERKRERERKKRTSADPTVGDTFRIDGQTYTVVGCRDHVTRYGRTVTLWITQATCTECGTQFECTTTKTTLHRGRPNRRCKAHRRKGSSVQDARG
jgi:hypothetical protein